MLPLQYEVLNRKTRTIARITTSADAMNHVGIKSKSTFDRVIFFNGNEDYVIRLIGDTSSFEFLESMLIKLYKRKAMCLGAGFMEKIFLLDITTSKISTYQSISECGRAIGIEGNIISTFYANRGFIDANTLVKRDRDIRTWTEIIFDAYNFCKNKRKTTKKYKHIDVEAVDIFKRSKIYMDEQKLLKVGTFEMLSDVNIAKVDVQPGTDTVDSSMEMNTGIIPTQPMFKALNGRAILKFKSIEDICYTFSWDRETVEEAIEKEWKEILGFQLRRFDSNIVFLNKEQIEQKIKEEKVREEQARLQALEEMEVLAIEDLHGNIIAVNDVEEISKRLNIDVAVISRCIMTGDRCKGFTFSYKKRKEIPKDKRREDKLVTPSQEVIDAVGTILCKLSNGHVTKYKNIATAALMNRLDMVELTNVVMNRTQLLNNMLWKLKDDPTPFDDLKFKPILSVVKK